MPQLHFYVPEEIAAKVRERAKNNKIPVSRYLADVIKRELVDGWPKGFFDKISGKWEGEFPELMREKPEDLEVF